MIDPDLIDAWNRLLRIDKLVEDLKGNIAIYSDVDAQKTIKQMDQALRGIHDDIRT